MGVSIVREGKRKNSLDTLPRSRLLLQTKMAAAPSKPTGLENLTEK